MAEQTTDQVQVLILGKHPSLTRGVIQTLEAAGYSGIGSQTDLEAIELASAVAFDVMLIGGGVPWDEHARAVEGVVAARPGIKVIRRGPGATGPVSLVEEALAAN
jgi:DNA-binding NarL/FixJ family response regulator